MIEVGAIDFLIIAEYHFLELKSLGVSFARVLPEMSTVIAGESYELSQPVGGMNHSVVAKWVTLSLSKSYALVGY
jgi:hypothetical protein